MYLYKSQRLGRLPRLEQLPSAFSKLAVESRALTNVNSQTSEAARRRQAHEQKKNCTNQTARFGSARAFVPRAPLHRRVLRSSFGPDGNLKASLSVPLSLPAPLSRAVR